MITYPPIPSEMLLTIAFNSVSPDEGGVLDRGSSITGIATGPYPDRAALAALPGSACRSGKSGRTESPVSFQL